jgi:hypothetical protein
LTRQLNATIKKDKSVANYTVTVTVPHPGSSVGRDPSQ